MGQTVVNRRGHSGGIFSRLGGIVVDAFYGWPSNILFLLYFVLTSLFCRVLPPAVVVRNSIWS